MEESHKAEQAAKPQKQSGDLFWKVATVTLIVILAVVAFRGNSGGGATGGTAFPTGAAVGGDDPSPTVVVKNIINIMNAVVENAAEEEKVKGDKDAPVTIVEWSDFECPFCARFYEQTLPSIEEEYIKTGKVKFVYAHFPLGFHANAQKAAEAAECAGEQGKYWEMHDLLFAQGVQGGAAGFKQYAKNLGLNTAKFDACLDSGAMAAEVQKDMADGAAVGIQGTPGFLINGKLVSGAQPFAVFKQVIDAELN
ncbi:MAG: thioredoxin domain-containing protein [Nanoarchaeota archaeon]|nr:thioredoxin domain-containing protein [Nanoarchaeota archaeon]